MESRKAPGKGRFAGIIREARRAAGLNQQQLADQLGVSRNTVAGWETGHSRPELDSVPSLCRALGLTLSSFFGLRETVSREERSLLKTFRQLGEADRQVLLWQIEAVASARAAERESARRLAPAAPPAVRPRAVRVWQSDLSAAAGTGVSLGEARGSEIWLRKDSVTVRADETVAVSGNSMEPTFHNGDQVLVEHTDSVREGEIGVFIVNGEGYIKEYRRDGLHSHNPEYRVMRFGEDSEVRCVGRVLGRLEEQQMLTAEEIEELEADHELSD